MKCLFVPKTIMPLLLILIVTVFLSGGCASSKDEGFAIYLTADDVPPAQMESSGHIPIAEQPIIGANDIISYNRQTNELKLSPSAFERIRLLDVPTSGKSFWVCVDRTPIYWGAFWTPLSSQSFDGVTIWQPLTTDEPYIIMIELGYPSSFFFNGNDPRNKPEIISALEKAGKLIDAWIVSEIDSLPRSMKGYELYSWLEEDEWHYTLITGTDRNKTLEEIVAVDQYISESGWINIHCTGAEAIKTVLSKIPSGEFVSWCNGAFISGGDKFDRPQQALIDEIIDYADAHGLELIIPETS